jgi:hypothetical protein
MACAFPGNLHEVVVELEGMGGGGKLQLEVSSCGERKFLVRFKSSRNCMKCPPVESVMCLPPRHGWLIKLWFKFKTISSGKIHAGMTT